MIIEFEINGARVIVSGENLSVSLTESVGAFSADHSKLAARFADESAASISEIATAAQGEAEAPSISVVSLTESSADANAGGENVDRSAPRAGHAGQETYALAGQIEPRIRDSFVDGNTSGPDAKRATITARAVKPLRPNCKNPGETCGGYGSRHCHSCEMASESEAA